MRVRATLMAIAVTMVASCKTTNGSASEPFEPDRDLASQLYGLIWYDLQSNAMIGNGNELAAAWANAGQKLDESPALHIEHLRCSGGDRKLSCEYELVREGGAISYRGKAVPARLFCGNEFRRERNSQEWSIPRIPPNPSGGHSKITIECAPAD